MTRDNIDRFKNYVLKSYENQINALTEENYYKPNKETLDLRIATELKKKLDNYRVFVLERREEQE